MQTKAQITQQHNKSKMKNTYRINTAMSYKFETILFI